MKASPKDFKPVSMRGVWAKTALLFVLSFLTLSTAIFYFEKTNTEHLKKEAVYYSAEQGLHIQRQLNQAFAAVHAVAGVIQMNPDSFNDSVDFEGFAQGLLPIHKSVASLQLAPDGIVRCIVPLKGNEKAIGHNLLTDPKRMVDAKRAIATRRLTLSGPYHTIQGGWSIIGRLPIFVTETWRPGDREYFWGFAIALADFQTILDATNLGNAAHSKYDYELSKPGESGKTPEIFSRSSDEKLEETIDFTFEVPNNEWTLSVKPKTGWVNAGERGRNLLGALLFSGLLAFLGYRDFKKPLVLQNMVAQRTKALEESNEALKSSQDQLYHLANHDVLTNLPNRALFEKRLRSALIKAEEKGHHVVLLYMDLDFFKPINDTWGHSVGDEVLRQVAQRMQVCVRKTDTVSRLGGDEFGVIIPELADGEPGSRLADNINRALQEPIAIRDLVLHVSGSIGCAVYPEDGRDVKTLSDAADQAMYRVKTARKKAGAEEGACQVPRHGSAAVEGATL